jgi:peptidyl-prolyl cis-trans isomerase SurA
MRLQKIVYALPALLALTGCHKSPPANVVATVNTRPITYGDIDRIYLAQFSAPSERAGDDLMAIQKMEVLRTLIENEIMLQRAEKLGLLATDSEVDTKFNELKAPYTQEEFQRQLETRKMAASDLKTQMRRELSIQKLVNREIISKIAITDKEIADFFNSNKASFNRAEPTIHLAQILVTAAPDPSARNLKNDKALNDDQAKKKIQMIEARLRQGDEFSMLAENYSEDPESTPNGGDLGFLPMSAFDKSSPHGHAARPSLSRHPQPGRLPHPEGDLQGACRSARPERSARAADHPRWAARPEGATPAERLLRSGSRRSQDRQLLRRERDRGQGKDEVVPAAGSRLRATRTPLQLLRPACARGLRR